FQKTRRRKWSTAAEIIVGPWYTVLELKRGSLLDSTQLTDLAKRLVYRRALIGEKLRTSAGNVETVFQTNAELAIDYDRWFVAKAHTRLDEGLVAAHEVRPFMAVEPDAVAGAMRKPRGFV